MSVKWGPSGREVYERTYSRRKQDGTQETWSETVRRVVDGNLGLVSSEFHLPNEREDLIELIENFRAIPAGRHLWTSGVPGRTFVRNCHRSGWGPDLADHFTFLFDELMKGGGVGANYSNEYLDALPPVVGDVLVTYRIDDDHPDAAAVRSTVGAVELTPLLDEWTHTEPFIVPDSREGWVQALRFVFEAVQLPGQSVIVFDLSEIRPSGSLIRGFGGTSSGPAPLIDALSTVGMILDEVDGQLTSLQAMAIDHAVARCVIAGNVRRSARMSIKKWSDPDIFDFISSKADTGDHWTTNISVEIDDDFLLAIDFGDDHATAVFNAVVDGMLTNGEPGFFNSSLASVGERHDVRSTNPCGEIALAEWESCNLGHVNLAEFVDDPFGAAEAFGLMARFLVRATFAELGDPRQQAIENENRRIGVGFFGFQEWLAGHGVRFSEAVHPDVEETLTRFRIVVRAAADGYADQLGIPRPVKVTAIAPTGSIAKLPGTTEGIHPVYARYYERRIRYAESDPLLWKLSQTSTIEDCIYSSNTKVVVSIVRDTILDKVDEHLVEQADEISVSDMLAVQAMVQECYADNAVSFTTNVQPDTSRDELAEALRAWLPFLKGTTVMVDASRPQSPYTRITSEEYLLAEASEVGQSFDLCSTGACPIR